MARSAPGLGRMGAPTGADVRKGPLGTKYGAPMAAIAKPAEGSGVEIAAAAAFRGDRRQKGCSNAPAL